MRFLATIALISATAAAPAWGQQQAKPPATLVAQIDALDIDRMCTADRAFGHAFGADDLPPNRTDIPGLDTRPMPEWGAPFALYSLDMSDWSRRFYRATYEMEVDDEAAADAVIGRIAARYRAQGWVEREQEPDSGDAFSDSFYDEETLTLYSDPKAATGSTRNATRVSLFQTFDTLYFRCTHTAMDLVRIDEMRGILPEGIARPVPPGPLPLRSVDLAMCETPEGQTKVREAIGSEPDAMSRFLNERTGYYGRNATWKLDRLRKSGKVSAGRLDQLREAGFRPAFGMMDPSLATVPAIAAAQAREFAERGEEHAACEATVIALRGFEKFDANIGREWRANEAVLDAEAKRLGISWD